MATDGRRQPIGMIHPRRSPWSLIAWALLLAGVATPASANLNLYLNQQEVRRLLGLTAELYYVREGVINEYALNFVVPVPAHIQDIYFTWQSIDRQVPYSMGIELDGDRESMDLPTLNISSKGNVPRQPQVFRLSFPCTGRSSSEVDVVLHLNVTLSEHRKGARANVTQLQFKRKKICLQEEQRPARNESAIRQTESLVPHSGTILIAAGSACTSIIVLLAVLSFLYIRKKKAMHQETAYDVPTYCSNASVYLAGGASRGVNGSGSAAGGRGSVAGSASYATIASFHKLPLTPASSVFPTQRSIVAPNYPNKTSSTFKSSGHGDFPTFHSNEVPAYQVSGLDFIHQTKATNLFHGSTPDSSTKSPALRSHHRHFKSSAASTGSVISVASSYDASMADQGERLKRLAVPRFRITLRNLHCEGTFGRVYSALYLHPETSREGQVLVKTVAEQASASQKTTFLAEGTQMAGLQHRHILAVLGCCMNTNNVPVIVYPWVSRGNLKRFLIHCRSGGVNTEAQIGTGSTATELRTTLLTQDVVDMAIQCVLAMIYLHRHRVIHRDVAARNCVIDDRLRIKVTDTALARDLFPDDYHCLGDSENRPIKWMALESVTQREYSTASDVWSFGVFLWELTTLAQQPYIEVDPFEMETYLKDDYRLAQPLNCPDELFAVMACCWIANPKERPTFLQLLACLQDFHVALGRFI